MRKIHVLLLFFSFSILLNGQDATIKKLPDGIAPVIDGYIDMVWDSIEAHNIEKQVLWKPGIPTVDVATWQAAWNDTAFFVLVNVEENDHCDQWCSGEGDWQSDRPEIYFDVNVGNLLDAEGPNGYPNGHHMAASSWVEGESQFAECNSFWPAYTYFCYGYNIIGENYVYEFAVPFSTLKDRYDVPLDPNTLPLIGFDVYIVDRDQGDSDFKMLAWMNSASDQSNISFNNMDSCGKVSLVEEEINFNNDSSGGIPSVYFHYISQDLYDVEITLFDIGTCDTLSIYQPSVTVDEIVEISFENPNFGYMTGTVSEDGDSIYGTYDIGNSNCNGSESGKWSVALMCPISNIPLLSYPADNSFNIPTTVYLTWYPVAEASYYELQLSEYQDFSSVLLFVSDISLNSYIISGLEEDSTYYWRVKSANNCIESAWSSIWSFCTSQYITGFQNTNNNSGYILYPSPTKDYINIKCPGSYNSIIEIFTIDSKLLIKEKIYNDITTIDVSDLSKGLYYLRVVNENTINTDKFIID